MYRRCCRNWRRRWVPRVRRDATRSARVHQQQPNTAVVLSFVASHWPLESLCPNLSESTWFQMAWQYMNLWKVVAITWDQFRDVVDCVSAKPQQTQQQCLDRVCRWNTCATWQSSPSAHYHTVRRQFLVHSVVVVLTTSSSMKSSISFFWLHDCCRRSI